MRKPIDKKSFLCYNVWVLYEGVVSAPRRSISTQWCDGTWYALIYETQMWQDAAFGPFLFV